MKNLFYVGLTFTGYSLFQLLGFISKAYPVASFGAILIILGLLLIILVVGIANWCGLYYQHRGIIDSTQTIVGLAPAFIGITLALFAVGVGIYAAS